MTDCTTEIPSDQSDVVENFARQLDELCATTEDLCTSDDEMVPFGYEQLPQEDEDDGTDEIDEFDYNDNVKNADSALPCHSNVSTTDMSVLDEDDVDRRELVLPITAPLTISLDRNEAIPEETSTLIKDIMKKCELPDRAIPDWAKSIPESSWMPKMNE
ncbi:hypothetical protein BCR42DRAFT_398562 [Absidia repens]|uniref:Male-enhanced antigen 1 n=1 Tax=Absidia repens TaxID=90262 RepID=A0A1X2HXN7_9FUNG|nr:hypothetical protein BCR42DRAFT_398562 [Absidia repens]